MTNLRYWRNDRQLSQFELAEVTGIGRAVIQLIEQGIRQPKPDELERLSEALGVKTSQLAGKGSYNDEI